MERNADVVQMASYAPLFANVNGVQWHPDLIYYDNSRSFATPSYYVQQMFSRNRGNVTLPTTVNVSTNSSHPAMHGAIGLGSWNTSVEYADIKVTSNDVTLYKDDFAAQGSKGWQVFNGDWNASNGHYRQRNDSQTDCRATTGDTNWANYTITLHARKTSGNEGFLILFNCLDDNNWTWLNVGGWRNTGTGIERSVGGTKSMLGSPFPQTITDNTWYDIRVVLTGSRIRCYVNDALVQDVSYPSGLYVSSTYAKASDEVIIKAVNPDTQPITTAFDLKGVNAVAPNATIVQLTSESSADENFFDSPTRVFPVTNSIANAGKNFSLTFPANSLSVLRLHAAGIKSFSNAVVHVP
jgi:alpha-L-arabinofuranosidase